MREKRTSYSRGIRAKLARKPGRVGSLICEHSASCARLACLACDLRATDKEGALFQSFQTLKKHDFRKAREAFKEVKFGLQRLIVWEEDLLSPLWQGKTGIPDGGPTFVMRAEHRQISEQLEAIHRKMPGKTLRTITRSRPS